MSPAGDDAIEPVEITGRYARRFKDLSGAQLPGQKKRKAKKGKHGQAATPTVHFTRDPIDTNTIPYKDKGREKQRQQLLKKQAGAAALSARKGAKGSSKRKRLAAAQEETEAAAAAAAAAIAATQDDDIGAQPSTRHAHVLLQCLGGVRSGGDQWCVCLRSAALTPSCCGCDRTICRRRQKWRTNFQ